MKSSERQAQSDRTDTLSASPHHKQQVNTHTSTTPNSCRAPQEPQDHRPTVLRTQDLELPNSPKVYTEPMKAKERRGSAYVLDSSDDQAADDLLRGDPLTADENKSRSRGRIRKSSRPDFELPPKVNDEPVKVYCTTVVKNISRIDAVNEAAYLAFSVNMYWYDHRITKLRLSPSGTLPRDLVEMWRPGFTFPQVTISPQRLTAAYVSWFF